MFFYEVEMIDELVRIEMKDKQDFSAATDFPSKTACYVVHGTDHIVHTMPIGNFFRVANLEEVDAKICRIRGIRPNAYELNDSDETNVKTVQLHSLNLSQYKIALEIQQRYISDFMLS